MVTFQQKKGKKRKKHCFINELVLKARPAYICNTGGLISGPFLISSGLNG